MDSRRRKIMLAIVYVLVLRRLLLLVTVMGRYYYTNVATNTGQRSRGRIRCSLSLKIPKQVEYLNRIIAEYDTTCVDKIRMSRDTFIRLCYLLRNVGGLNPTKHVGVEENFASFLVILAHHTKNRIAKFDFRRSGETVSRQFHSVLHAVLRLHHILLVNPTPVTEDETNEQWKPFKGCLGTLDVTYIPVTVPLTEAPRHRNRKGFVSVNVLGVCDRDMKFVYLLSGWEGSAADSRVLRAAISKQTGLKVPQGNYSLVDGGYANSDGFLAPFRCIRYHLKEWEPGHLQPQNEKEYFNMKHSKARNVVERAFGLLKKRWAILRSPSFYPIKTQNKIILACGLLHNFIRTYMDVDPMEEDIDTDPLIDEGNQEYIDNISSSEEWTRWRDELATSMYNEWIGHA